MNNSSSWELSKRFECDIFVEDLDGQTQETFILYVFSTISELLEMNPSLHAGIFPVKKVRYCTK